MDAHQSRIRASLDDRSSDRVNKKLRTFLRFKRGKQVFANRRRYMRDEWKEPFSLQSEFHAQQRDAEMKLYPYTSVRRNETLKSNPICAIVASRKVPP